MSNNSLSDERIRYLSNKSTNVIKQLNTKNNNCMYLSNFSYNNTYSKKK